MVLDLCLLLAEKKIKINKKINKWEKKNEKKKKGYKSFLGHR